MMKHTATLGAVLTMLFLLLPCEAAETARDDRPYVSAMRSLSLNHSLLAKAEAEYRELQEQEAHDTTGSVARRLSDLRYKIQAFNEDAERLKSLIPADKKEFIPGPTPEHVDVAAEKRVADSLGKIYRMHEQALRSVAQQKYEEAEKIYEEIVLLSPDDDEAYLLLGHAGLAAGHYRKAGRAFHNAIHIRPENAREITRLYENILVENPSDDDALTQLGYAHLLLGSAENARHAFQDALTIDPKNEEARKGLVEVP